MIENILTRGLTRRQFIKASAAVAATTAIAGNLTGAPGSMLVQRTASAAQETVVKHGNCAFCQQGDCQTIYKMINGVVVKVEGDPSSPISQGRLCARGNSAIMNLYNAYRVKAPLKRTNPDKGVDVDPKWVEISWDEALNTVGEKLKAVKAKDPRGLVVNESFGSKETIIRTPFQQASGTPNMVGSHGPTCSVHYAGYLVQGGGPVSVPDLTYTEYHITQGRTAAFNFAVPPASRRLTAALERGMKFIDIDPRNSEEGSKGEWVPIRPGTETAFNLAMASVMMWEIKKIDEWFLKARTNAVYLIDAAGDYVRDPDSKKPLMMNGKTNKAVPFDDPNYLDTVLEGNFTVNGVACQPAYQAIKTAFKQYTPEWQEPITTIPAATVRRVANDFVNASHIGSTIVVDGFTFPFRPATFNNERGTADHRGGTYADLTTKIISMLIGNIEVPGGMQANVNRGTGPLKPDANGTVTPAGESLGVPWVFPPDHVDMSEFYPNKHTGPHLTIKAILDPKKYYLNYTIDVWIGAGGNSWSSMGGQDLYVNAMKKVGFIATIAYHYDAPTILADVVLPENSFMERLYAAQAMARPHQNVSDEMSGLFLYFVRNPVSKLYNTMHCDEIYMELAARAGYLFGKGGINDRINGTTLTGDLALDLNKKYTIDEIFDRRIKAWDPDKKATLTTLLDKGNTYYWVDKKLGYNYYYYPDNKTRHPFYFYHLKEVADGLKANMAKAGAQIPGWDNQQDYFDYFKPIPHWKPNTENVKPAGDPYDMWAINWKTPFYANGVGAPHENVWLEDIIANHAPYHNHIWINPKTAAARGIKDGDTIVVESRGGKTQGPVILTEMIHPEVVGFPGMRGTGTLQQNPIIRVGTGPHYNRLIRMDDYTFDPVNGSMDVAPRVKIYKA
jgi:anaerobic selenocysteine-containing dehydrogenase